MKHSIILCMLFLACMGCKDDPEPAKQLLVNTDMEAGATSPNDWWDMEQTGYTTEWTTEEANSGSRSLKISAIELEATNFAFWTQSYVGAIPVGEDVVLSVKVKCKNISGEGVSIVIRGDTANGQGQFISTEGRTPITGDFDWTTFDLRLDEIQGDIKSIIVFLVFLPNTVGTVYFDDATLVVQ
jgi:hypothetical protein